MIISWEWSLLWGRWPEYIDKPAKIDSPQEQKQRELRDIIVRKDSSGLEAFLKANADLEASVRTDVEILQSKGLSLADYFRILYEPSKTFKGNDVELGWLPDKYRFV